MLTYFLFMSFFYFSISFYLFFRTASSINIVLYLLFQIICSWLTLSFLQISCVSSRQFWITFSFVVLLHLKWNHLCHIHTAPVSQCICHTLFVSFHFSWPAVLSQHDSFLFYFLYSLTV